MPLATLETVFQTRWKNILTFDIEAENHKLHERVASQFSAENWVIAIGWQYNNGPVQYRYYATKEEVPQAIMPDLSNVNLVIGHNIKYDLLWVWEDPNFQAFLAAGGEIYDTQYAEYLLHAMEPSSHMNAMNDIALKYGGGSKLDAVKDMWEAGYLTSQIPKDLLIDYLVGKECVSDPSRTIIGDVRNTWIIFCGQIQRIPSMHPLFLSMLIGRMDGLLATTEMEYNGIFCDKNLGIELRAEELKEVNANLDVLMSFVPELPEELEWNWNSPNHKSALFFGGTIKYSKWVQHRDENGYPMYSKQSVPWPLFNGEAVNPALCVKAANDLHLLPVSAEEVQAYPKRVEHNMQWYAIQDSVKAGKNKGTLKTKKVSVPDFDKPKGCQTPHYIKLKGYAKPDDRWKTANEDVAGDPMYSTGEKVVKKLVESANIPFLDAFVKYNKKLKDMETYYWAEDETGAPTGGMLTLVNSQWIIHHGLNHTSTKTGRLSSSRPNMQTMPRKKGSRVKRMLKSRFGSNGKVAEIDYSQLEVIDQAVLTGDAGMIRDLNNKVDFHIKRLANKLHRPYDELWDLHHVQHDDYVDDERTKAKVYSFQSAYGAGIPTIAYDTGMSKEEVQALADADDINYPGIKRFDDMLARAMEEQSVPSSDNIFINNQRINLRKTHWDSPTGTRYSWREQEAPDWLQRKGKHKGFSPTERKNYPAQGLGGEVIEVMLGRLFRWFLANNRFNGQVLMTNTVHDCLWLDGVKGWIEPVAIEASRIMEKVPQVFQRHYDITLPVQFPVELEMGDDMYDMQVIKHEV